MTVALDTSYAPSESENIVEDLPVVLVVDDNVSIRRLVKLFLRKKYQVLEAGDHSEAFRWLDLATQSYGVSGNPVRAVLLDIMLPGLDGFRMCRRIKKEYHIPVIMLSALHSGDDVARAIEQGADDYVAKPFNQATLLAKLERWVGGCTTGPARS